MPRKQPKPGHSPLQVDDFPDRLRDRLHVVAAQQKTTARAIVVEAVERAVREREGWALEQAEVERALREHGIGT